MNFSNAFVTSSSLLLTLSVTSFTFFIFIVYVLLVFPLLTITLITFTSLSNVFFPTPLTLYFDVANIFTYSISSVTSRSYTYLFFVNPILYPSTANVSKYTSSFGLLLLLLFELPLLLSFISFSTTLTIASLFAISISLYSVSLAFKFVNFIFICSPTFAVVVIFNVPNILFPVIPPDVFPITNPLLFDA